MTDDQARHQPVMLDECLHWLAPTPGVAQLMVDGTAGEGGHAEQFLERFPQLTLVAVDADQVMLERAGAHLQRFGERVRYVCGWFADVLDAETAPVHRILLDLGISSHHYFGRGRGFSFRADEPLDMRLDDHLPRTAADIVNEETEAALAEIFHRYGEEPRARRFARAVTSAREQRPLETAADLEQVLWRATRPEDRRRRIHPATRVFQALRIAVNDELGQLQRGLSAAARRLTVGGRLAVIAFHSLEDRIVKHFLRNIPGAGADASAERAATGAAADDPRHGLRALVKRPLRPSAAEAGRNPRARSARLRLAEKQETVTDA